MQSDRNPNSVSCLIDTSVLPLISPSHLSLVVVFYSSLTLFPDRIQALEDYKHQVCIAGVNEIPVNGTHALVQVLKLI